MFLSHIATNLKERTVKFCYGIKKNIHNYLKRKYSSFQQQMYMKLFSAYISADKLYNGEDAAVDLGLSSVKADIKEISKNDVLDTFSF